MKNASIYYLRHPKSYLIYEKFFSPILGIISEEVQQYTPNHDTIRLVDVNAKLGEKPD